MGSSLDHLQKSARNTLEALAYSEKHITKLTVEPQTMLYNIQIMTAM